MAEPFARELEKLVDPVAALVASLHTAEEQAAAELRAVDPAHLQGARNLVHYLALRRHDLRELQDRLASVGLSSLGRAESGVESTLLGVLDLLTHATGRDLPVRETPEPIPLASGRRRLAEVTDLFFGPQRKGRRVRILVTLPAAAADDPGLVRELMRGGMDAARINCAHDEPVIWERMIANVRQSAAELGSSCRVIMDLAGPKLRTGALTPGPQVVRVRPRRDARGRVVAPAQVWFSASEVAGPASSPATTIPVDRAWLAGLRPGHAVELVDAREEHRKLEVLSTTADGALAAARHTIYFETGRILRHSAGETRIGSLASVEQPVVVHPGDTLIVSREGAAVDEAHVTCSLPQVFADVKPGHRIWFDDGAIGGHVVAVSPEKLTVEILEARPGGSKLRGDKGINLPDTQLRLPPLDANDESNLAFIASHADAVGYSFVRRPSDVLELQHRLAGLGRRDLGIMLKIETREAFENLPLLLLAAMRLPAVSVMIARGDLAVECGWERLAELQEEILWICEAARVPVVWATQVLEHLTKEGHPSRAEITDAAMGERAECVMLNKGPHVLEAVHVLDDILRRMEGHQAKKRAMLRPLALAERFGRSMGG